MNRSFKSKLGKRRSQKHLSGVCSVENAASPSNSTVFKSESQAKPLRDRSPPLYFLNSQATMPEKEVYWDYDTPQIKSYRSRMGVGVRESDDSSPPTPLILQERVSTPKLKLHSNLKPRVLTDLETSDAKAAFDDIKAFCDKLNSRKLARSSASTDISPVCSEETQAVQDSDSAMFSDDDSLLIRCTQEAEERLETFHIQVEDRKNFNEEGTEFGMDSDDSFDMMLSQMDEKDTQLVNVSNERQTNAGEHAMINRDVNPGASVAKNPLEPCNRNLKSPTKDRSMKRFKSSDDGILRKRSPSLRKIRSSPVIPIASTQSRACTQAEIEQKKLAAKRRRQLSQMKSLN